MSGESLKLSSYPSLEWRGVLTKALSERLELYRHQEAEAAPPLRGSFYSSSALRRRVIQRTLNLGYEDFLKNAMRSSAQFCIDREFRAGPVTIAPDGRLRIDPLFFVSQIAEFLKLNVYFLFVILKSIFTAKQLGAATYVSNLGANVYAGGDDQRLVEFFKRGPISKLHYAKRFVVQAQKTPNQTAVGYCEYAPRPAIRIFEENKLPISRLFPLVRFQGSTFIQFLWQILRSPAHCLLARDFALTPMWVELNDRQLVEAVILTDADYASQDLFWSDLPARKFEVHCLWHSQNTRPVILEGQGEQWEFPHRRYMAIDKSWYWTPDFQAWLDKVQVRGEGQAVGAIMFQTDREAIQSAGPVRVCVFDVTPTHTEWQRENGWPYLYYNYEVCRQFLDDIISKVREIAPGAQIVLKHKRAFGPIHDPVYCAYVADLAQRGVVQVVDSDTNIFSLVRSCQMVISIPFTTAALVGPQVGVPSIYYDPTARVVIDALAELSPVHTVKGPDSLYLEVSRFLSSSAKIM